MIIVVIVIVLLLFGFGFELVGFEFELFVVMIFDLMNKCVFIKNFVLFRLGIKCR